MRRIGAALGTAGGLLAAGLGILLGAVFIVAMLGGGVYRTECTLENGVHTNGWGLEGDIPYLWSPNDDRCETHTLTRYVLGKVGVMKDLDR